MGKGVAVHCDVESVGPLIRAKPNNEGGGPMGQCRNCGPQKGLVLSSLLSASQLGPPDVGIGIIN